MILLIDPGHLTGANMAKSGYFVQPANSFRASAKQAPANSVLNQCQSLFCLARFCLSHLRTNFRGCCLVLRRCDT